MAVKKLGISLTPELAEEAVRSAAAQGVSLSSWIAEAVAARLRQRNLGRIVDQHEAEFGPIPQAELDEVDRLWPA